MLSVVIKENFSWFVSYRKQLISPEDTGVLKSIPSDLNNSGTYICAIIIHKCYSCMGTLSYSHIATYMH